MTDQNIELERRLQVSRNERRRLEQQIAKHKVPRSQNISKLDHRKARSPEHTRRSRALIASYRGR